MGDKRLHFITRLAGLAILILVTEATAEDWWRFRGPNGTGVAAAKNLPTEFGPERGVAWKVETPAGRSSPILVGDALVLTGVDNDRLLTIAVSRKSGETLWRAELERSRRDNLYEDTNSANGSPVSDGENLYVFFTELGLVSFDLAGKERWRVEMGPYRNYYGIGSSPIIAGDQVLMLVDQVEGSYLVALDAATGKQRWRADRHGRIESWTTPVLYPADAPRQAIVFGSGWLDAYDLETGASVWAMPGLGEGPIGSPSLVGNRVIVAAPNHDEDPMPSFASFAADVDKDKDGRLAAAEFATLEGWDAHFGWIDRNSDGFITKPEYTMLKDATMSKHFGLVAVDLPAVDSRDLPEIAWSQKQSVAYMSSPTVYDGVVFMVKDGGIVSSVDLGTGEVFKRARSSRSAGQQYSSPVAADGKLYLGTASGEMAVLSVGAQWNVLAVNDLAEPIYSTPLPKDGRLYVRTASHLYAFQGSTE